MKKIQYGLIVLALLLGMATTASARISVGISFPNVSVGINVPVFPQLVPVPGYPVYYAPQMNSNYFFYDGMYWVYESDNWYASSWYDGPWDYVEPAFVPLFILRVPVAYYRDRPRSFRGYHSNAPPRWGQRWGHEWEQRRSGWDRWDRRSAPARAPRPEYQRNYSKDRYPHAEQQRTLHKKNYRYQPHEKEVRRHLDSRQGRQDASDSNHRGSKKNVQGRDSRSQDQNHRSRGNGKSQNSKNDHGKKQQKDDDRDRGRDH